MITTPVFGFFVTNSSFSITDYELLVVGEEVVCTAFVYNVIGPQSDLTLQIQEDSPHLEITDVVYYIGDNLNHSSPVLQIENDRAEVVFPNLVRHGAIEDTVNGSVIVDVHLLCISDEPTNHFAYINASMTFSSLTAHEQLKLIVAPTSEVLVALTGPSDLFIEADRDFNINVTIQHASNRSHDAHDLLVFLDYCEEFVSAPNSFTVLFSHGYESDIGFSLIENGYFIPLLPRNETIVLLFTFRLLPDLTISEELFFNASITYSNAEFGMPRYLGSAENRIALVTEDYLTITSDSLISSSPYTGENQLAINEVFRVPIQFPVPPGESTIRIVATIGTNTGIPPPILILETMNVLPPCIEANASIIHQNPGNRAIQIIWDFGRVLNPSELSGGLIEMSYTAAIQGSEDILSLNNLRLELAAFSIVSNLSNSTVESSVDIVVPLLRVSVDAFETEDEPGHTVTTIELYHDDISTGSAFLVRLLVKIPSILILVPDSITVETTADYSISMNEDSSTSLALQVRVLPITDQVILKYEAIPNSENTAEGITELEPIQLSYSTIIQEGIGQMFADVLTETNVVTDASTGVCFFKTVVVNRKVVSNGGFAALSFFIGLIVVLGAFFAGLGIYYFVRSRKNQRVRPHFAPAALIATAVMGRDQSKEDILNFIASKRPLVSNLLLVLLKKMLGPQDDALEFKEAVSIGEVERSLLCVEGQMITHLFRYFLRTKSDLSKNEAMKIDKMFTLKVNVLRKTLLDGLHSDLQDTALQFGADKIIVGEKMDSNCREEFDNIKQELPMEMTTSHDILQHVQEQKMLEKIEALELIDMKHKKKSIQLIRSYTDQYLFGLKGIAVKLLCDASIVKESDSDEFHSALEYAEQLKQTESETIEEMANVRARRQKAVLIDKRLIEEADEQWQILFMEQIDKVIIAHNVMSTIDRLKEISLEEKKAMRKELKVELLKDFHEEIKNRKSEMKAIVSKAVAELKDLESNLPKTSESQYYTNEKSMLESEFQKWHIKEMKREEALKEVEDSVSLELAKCWERWGRKRDHIMANFEDNLKKVMISRGLGIEHCTATLQIYVHNAMELREGLETNKVVQDAKFQARLKYLEEKMSSESESNQDMHQMKVEIENEHLKKMVEEVGKSYPNYVGVSESYSHDVMDLDRSISVEKLTVLIKLKEKIAVRRKQKFEAAYEMFKKGENLQEELLRDFLVKRRDIVFEMCTRAYEEERKKAEEEHEKEKENRMNASAKVHILPKPRKRVKVVDHSQADPDSETKKLLLSHQEDLTKLSNQLDSEREKAAKDLERRMKQRREQHERVLSQLAQPEKISKGFKSSRFREAAQKVILTTRLEKIREQHSENLAKAMETLKQQFDAKKQENEEKLGQKLEVHLAKYGKLSTDKLVEVFKQISYTGDVSVIPRTPQHLPPLQGPGVGAKSLIEPQK